MEQDGLDEAKREGQVNVAWDGKATNFDRLPKPGELKLNPDAAYVYCCSNETIQGVQFKRRDRNGRHVPLVCDASSDFLHRPLPVSKYGLIYACAQKNAGSAGVTAVIIRDDLVSRSADEPPRLSQFQEPRQGRLALQHAADVCDLPDEARPASGCKDEVGGLAKMHQRNKDKAKLLYDVIDASGGFYRGHAQPDCRSLMNVTFRLPSEDLEKQFVKEGEDRGLDGLKGHRSVGGIRASIYNAMPPAGVESLANFMREFKQKRG